MPISELEQVNVFWFRRDLRLDDNQGLSHALKSNLPVLPIFIFDIDILSGLSDPFDSRVSFIHQQLESLNRELIQMGSCLTVLYGTVESSIEKLIRQYKINDIYCNRDYEPYAKQRDELIRHRFATQSIGFKDFKDQVIFEKSEIVKNDGKPYTVFTPYMKKWKLKLHADKDVLTSFDTSISNFLQLPARPVRSLDSITFKKSPIKVSQKPDIDLHKISRYHVNRNFPGLNGTTRLSVHLRFGTISIRKLAAIAVDRNETFLNELIWREFYMMILWNFPRVVNEAFKSPYNQIPWINDEASFQKWCSGQTGYPLVDAGMRELNNTGFMHNRVRMVTASFLAKHLLINWQWGEAYFGEKLLDFELSSNNGGWQWAAGSGCDAAPYFRVFNPSLQAKKFDPELKYIRKWIPELESTAYPKPLVDHSEARSRAIEVYKNTLSQYSGN